MRRTIVLLSAALALVVCAQAWAAPPAPAAPAESNAANRNRARKLFAEAEAAFDADKFDVALQGFQAAQAAAYSAVVDFNIAVCLERLGRTQEAARVYAQVADDERVPTEVRRRAHDAESAYKTVGVDPPPPTNPRLPTAEPDALNLAQVPPPPAKRDRLLSPLGWTGATLAAAGLVTASAVWWLGENNRDEYNRTTDLMRAEQLADRGDVYDATSKIGIGLAITGGLMVLADRIWFASK